MKQSDITIGTRAWTLVAGVRTLVEVVAEVPGRTVAVPGYRDRTSRPRWRIRRVDTDHELPKARTAAALHEVQS